MESTDKKSSAEEIAEPGKEARLLDKKQLDEVAGVGWTDEICPYCE